MTKDSGTNSETLSFGPQEWLWFLQDRNLVPEIIEWEAGTAVKSMDSLPPTAAILGRHALEQESDNNEVCIAQALLWLHKASVQDVKILEKPLVEAKSQQVLLEKRSSLYETNYVKATQDWNALCSDSQLSDLITVDTENITQLVLDWKERQQTPRLHDEKERLESHATLLEQVLTNYKQACKRTRQQPKDMDTLQQVLSNNVAYNNVTSNNVRMDLEELLSFYQSRRNECAKQSIPAFMTLEALDNVETLEALECGLQKVLKDMSGSCGGNVVENVHLLGTLQDRVQTAKERVQQNAVRLEEVKEKIWSMQQDIEWCKERIESVKTTLKEEITTLLKDESAVEIIL